MAFGYQRIIAMGVCGTDELVLRQAGETSVLNFPLGVQERKDGPTEWIKCAAWGATASFLAGNLTKGKRVLIEGRLNTSTYEKDGATRYNTQVNIDHATLVDFGTRERGESPATEPSHQAVRQTKAW